MTAAPDSGGQDAVVAFIEQGGLDARCEDRIDTHAAIVFLAGDRAWKLKRAVRFDYLDFSTSEQRRAALEAELRLNQRTAPELYLALHKIAMDEEGRLALDGCGSIVDWLLEMKRFPQAALLDRVAERGKLDDLMLMTLADRIRNFHRAARIEHASNGAKRILAVIDGNRASMGDFPDILPSARVEALTARQTEQVSALAGLLDRRARAGGVRHCHGDLHLANIAVINGVPTPFDCLEFSAELATIDVLYDLAFLLMDLWQRGLQREADIVFNRYLDVSPEHEAGLPLLSLFMSIRATIRAHVAAARSRRVKGDPGAVVYEAVDRLNLAFDLLEPPTPRLIAVGGLSGSGKSTVARSLGAVGRAPGARVVRSDVVRKRLAGVVPEARLPKTAYTAQNSRLVYEAVRKAAKVALDCGQSVIVDAVFHEPSQRRLIGQTARRAGVRFDGLWLDARTETRVRRIALRLGDASDANAAVAEAQRPPTIDALEGWAVVSAEGTVDETVTEARHVLGIPQTGSRTCFAARPKNNSAKP